MELVSAPTDAYVTHSCSRAKLRLAMEVIRQDIQTLAEYGARRMMECLKKGNVDTLSFQELVVFALMTGEANTRLTQRKVGEQEQASKDRWSVRGFFAKPGIKVETEKKGQVRQAVYLSALAGTP